MHVLKVVAGLALTCACGSSRPATEQASSPHATEQSPASPAPTVSQELLSTAQLRVSRVTLGTLGSGEPSVQMCAADLLFAEQHGIVVTVGDVEQDGVAWRVMPGEALLLPSHASWSAVSVHGEGAKKSTALYARASPNAAQCPRANEVVAYKIPPSGPVWHDNADGKLLVRMLMGGAGAEQLPMSLAELRGEAGFSVPSHVHEASDESLWISSGSGTMRVGDKAIEVHADQWIHVPRGTVHSFESNGSEPLVALQMYVPSGPEQRFIQ